MSEKIRVLVVDDSGLRRKVLKSILESDPSIEVVGTAKDGKEGVEKALSLKPSVITMDLQMPVMSGIEATEKIMQELPTPIIVASAMEVRVIVKALSIGAMDFVSITRGPEEIAKDLIEKVKIASRVRPVRRMKIKPKPVPSKKRAKKGGRFGVVAIGVSTGGPQALHTVLSGLPADFPAGILIVQHMSRGFIGGLAELLTQDSCLDVRVAKVGDVLKSATVLFAPDDYDMKLDGNAKISLSEDKSGTMLHVPSIDVMMESVAASCGENAVGVIMTGMGRDGVQGMRSIKRAGGTTIAQDERTSAIFGMNKAAIRAGCVDKIIPLDKIADGIRSSL